MEVHSLNESYTKLSFKFLKENQNVSDSIFLDLLYICMIYTNIPLHNDKIILGSNKNLLENGFSELKILYFKESQFYSIESVIGHLISNDESNECFCGSIFPISILSKICETCLSLQTFLAFIQVCKCFQPDLHIILPDQIQSNEYFKLKEKVIQINKFHRNTELPGNFIWSLLALSEIFGCHYLFHDCIKKLGVIIKQNYLKSKKSISNDKGDEQNASKHNLSMSLISDINNEYISIIESKIIKYLSTYTTLLQNTPLMNYNHDIVTEDKSIFDNTIISSNSNHNSYTDKSATSSLSSKNNLIYKYNKPSNTQFLTESSNTDDKYSNSGESITSYVTDASDLSIIPAAAAAVAHTFQPLPPPPPLLQYNHRKDEDIYSDDRNKHHTLYMGYSLVDDNSYDDKFINSNYDQNINNPQYYDRKDNIMETNDIIINKSYYNNSQQYQSINSNSSINQSYNPSSSYDRNGHYVGNLLSQGKNSNNNLHQLIDNNFNNSTSVNSSNNTPIKIRSQSKNSLRSEQRANSPAAFGSSTTRPFHVNNTKIHPTNYEDYQIDKNQFKKTSISSPEDLRLSRDIALLRLKEVKVKEEIEQSRLHAEKALRDNHLKALALKASIARVRTTNRSPSSINPGIHSPSPTNRGINSPSPTNRGINSPSPTNRGINSPSSINRGINSTIRSSSNMMTVDMIQKQYHSLMPSNIQYPTIHQQTDHINEARLKAVQRIRETRKMKELNEKKQNLIKTQINNEKWKQRDQKIEQFQLKQNQKYQINPIIINNNINNQKLLDQALFGNEQITDNESKISINNKIHNNIINDKKNSNNNSLIQENIRYHEYENENEDHYDEEEIITSGLYSKEALAAVGLGFSPNSVIHSHSPSSIEYNNKIMNKSIDNQYDNQNHNELIPPKIDISKDFQRKEEYISKQPSNNEIISSTISSGATLISPIKHIESIDILSIKVLRAYGLFECLGGTNAYVVLDWGKYGKSSTQAVTNSIEPHFGATLQFKSPYQKILNQSNQDRIDVDNNEYNNILHMNNNKYISNAGSMKIFIYSRNHSISDELIAWGEINPHEHLLLYQTNNNNNENNKSSIQNTFIVHLFDPNQNTNNVSAGSLEYMIIPYFIS